MATLVEASVNTFSERFDIGMNETLAISAVNKKISQKTNLAFPSGLGNLLGMGYLIFLNIFVRKNNFEIGIIMSIEQTSEIKVNSSFQYHI